MNRSAMLDAAKKCVTGERQQDYGTPENNFSTIAMMWSAYLHGQGYDHKFTAVDVAAMMLLMKVARISSGNGKEDSWVDAAGYAACGCEIEFPDGLTMPNQIEDYSDFLE